MNTRLSLKKIEKNKENKRKAKFSLCINKNYNNDYKN